MVKKRQAIQKKTRKRLVTGTSQKRISKSHNHQKSLSWHQNLEEPADARFLNLIHQAAPGPRKRYPDTQTESPETGRDSEAQVSVAPCLGEAQGQQRLPERDERRLNHVRVHSDIAPHKATVWSLREDDRHRRIQRPPRPRP
ncbi:unnamed protein product [Nyctereutes procyonoides]|uniref:(raccoon dog) hypothetical protein n=1 Tax=Nyctereutes procyonoides TaxID=34880 RepID=A0A811Z1U7_NYCPR|nr:unnamed protein product [Nyctereutes procyonoides]